MSWTDTGSQTGQKFKSQRMADTKLGSHVGILQTDVVALARAAYARGLAQVSKLKPMYCSNCTEPAAEVDGDAQEPAPQVPRSIGFDNGVAIPFYHCVCNQTDLCQECVLKVIDMPSALRRDFVNRYAPCLSSLFCNYVSNAQEQRQMHLRFGSVPRPHLSDDADAMKELGTVFLTLKQTESLQKKCWTALRAAVTQINPPPITHKLHSPQHADQKDTKSPAIKSGVSVGSDLPLPDIDARDSKSASASAAGGGGASSAASLSVGAKNVPMLQEMILDLDKRMSSLYDDLSKPMLHWRRCDVCHKAPLGFADGGNSEPFYHCTRCNSVEICDECAAKGDETKLLPYVNCFAYCFGPEARIETAQDQHKILRFHSTTTHHDRNDRNGTLIADLASEVFRLWRRVILGETELLRITNATAATTSSTSTATTAAPSDVIGVSAAVAIVSPLAPSDAPLAPTVVKQIGAARHPVQRRPREESFVAK